MQTARRVCCLWPPSSMGSCLQPAEGHPWPAEAGRPCFDAGITIFQAMVMCDQTSWSGHLLPAEADRL